MSKKKTQGGLPYNKLEALAECKRHFLSLCQMYDYMGKLFSLQTRMFKHPMIARTAIPQSQARILEQYQEIGEEMKSVGTLLDLLGGKAVMKAEEPKTKKVEVEEEFEKEKKAKKEEKFISNIAPEKKEEKE